MKHKLFYGWYMVIAAMVLAAINSSALGYGWTAFVGPVSATFTGWSMAEISLGSSLRSLETGVFNPLWGPIVDRWSPRWLMRAGVIVNALGLLCLSQAQNLWMFYGGFVLVGTGSSLVTQMLPVSLIARWFKRDIGKANGLFYMGNALGGVSVPLVVAIIAVLGWRDALLYTAVVSLAFGLLASFIFRTRPEDYGLVPDGKVETGADGRKKPAASVFGTSVREALKMRAFWHIATVTLFQNAVISTVMFYAIPYLTNLGMDRGTASMVVMIYTFISLFGRVPFGMISDIFRKSYVVAFCTALLIIGLLLYWKMEATSPLWFILLFAVPYGLGVSGITATRSPLVADYFGTKNFGSIFGFTSIFQAAANVISPPIAGWLYDNYHDYKMWWISLIIFGIFGLLSIITIPAPRRVEQKETEPVTQAK